MTVKVKLATNFEQIMIDAADAELHQFAEDVLIKARKLSRLGTKKRGSRHPGAYRKSLHIKKKPNGGYQIIANVPHATFEEFGRHREKGNRTLGRALITTPFRSK